MSKVSTAPSSIDLGALVLYWAPLFGLGILGLLRANSALAEAVNYVTLPLHSLTLLLRKNLVNTSCPMLRSPRAVSSSNWAG